MAILLTLPSNPTLSYNRLSSFSSTADNLSLSLSSLTLHRSNNAQSTKPLTIRMGGGPRTYPGGVSKWQWKRMQKKKATQLLKARLMRERQIYEMRKRAELKAAVSELERPWEVVEQAAPNLFSVGADEQLKVLADRFQKPGGFDLWTEKDGPQLFETPDGLPTSRFFPKGVVHSIKPYGRVNLDEGLGGIEDQIDDMSGGRLKESSNSEQESGQWLTGSRISMKLTGRCSVAEDSDEESSHPLNSRVLSGVNRRRSGQRNLDKKGSGSQRDRNLRGRFSETEGTHGDRSYSSNSRVFSSVNRPQSDQRNSDKKGSGSRRDGDLRKIGNRRSVGSGGANGAIRLPNWRQSASSTRERRNSSSGQIDGNKGSRHDSRLEKRRNSSYPEELYDLSLQSDGSYSLGSS